MEIDTFEQSSQSFRLDFIDLIIYILQHNIESIRYKKKQNVDVTSRFLQIGDPWTGIEIIEYQNKPH